MASEASSLPPLLAPVVQGSAITPAVKRPEVGGTNLPPSGNSTATAAAPKPVTQASDPSSLVAFLNRALNDSGRPDQFRLDPASDGKFIQEINPASGEVVAEYAIAEFPALARGIGASGLLVDRVT